LSDAELLSAHLAPAGPSHGALAHLQSVAQPLERGIRLEDLERLITVGVGTFGRVYMVRHNLQLHPPKEQLAAAAAASEAPSGGGSRSLDTTEAVAAASADGISHARRGSGSGAVRAPPPGRLYALKELKKATLLRLNQTRNVVYERAVMAAVRHPFLLRLVATFQDDTKLYMLTDYVHGGELFNLLGDLETLPSYHARFYAACVLCGLAHLHSLGIVYRDLKPENLLIDRQGYIRVVDFGFCKYVGPGERTYTLCGTPAYIAYEMVKGTGYTHAVD